jgi:hypothetical protein
MSPENPLNQPGKTQVPGQFLGYGLQYTRMLAVLLEPGDRDVVSLEVFEDVGAEGPAGTVASQTKSSLSGNPVSNGSDTFWKPLRNWLDAIKSGQLSPEKTIFELYVFGDYQGEICTLFSNAKSDSEALKALSRSKEIIAATSVKASANIEPLLRTENQANVVALIKNFRYRHGSGSSISDLKKQLEGLMIPSEFVDKVLTHAIGWLKQQVDTLIENGKPARILVTDFRGELAAYTRALAFSACLADMAGPVTVQGMEGHVSRWYVMQLDLIAATDERKLGAISAYLRSSVNRAEWARLALVHESSLDDFENGLVEYWKNSRAQSQILLGGKEKNEQGQYLLAECMKCKPHLQGHSTPYDFVEGCFHALADQLTLGWHPDFETLTADWK